MDEPLSNINPYKIRPYFSVIIVTYLRKFVCLLLGPFQRDIDINNCRGYSGIRANRASAESYIRWHLETTLIFTKHVPYAGLNLSKIVKANPRRGECYTCFGYKTKSGVVCILIIFQCRPMFSHINMESSRRDLWNDMAEHRSILENTQNTYHARFGFTPKTDIAFAKMGVLFYCKGVT